MRLFGFLGAPFRFIERITGERASRQKATRTAELLGQERNNLAAANAKASAQQKRLRQMLGELSGLDKQQKTLARDYKTKLKTLESEEHHLKDMGERYSETVRGLEAKNKRLQTYKSQLEERGAKLEGRSASLEGKLKEIGEGAKKIDDTEIKTLAEQFQQKYAAAETSREKLKGVSRETSPELFSRHQKLVKELGALRKNTESAIKAKHAGLSETHQKIAQELNSLQKDYQDVELEKTHIQRGAEKLARKKEHNDTYQSLLEPALAMFSKSQEAFKKEAQGLKAFQQKVGDLEKSYTAKKGEAEALQKEMKGTNALQDQLVARLNALQEELGFHAQRYQERAGRAGLFKAGLVGLAAMGGGAALGVGGGVANLAAGLGVFGVLNNMKNDVNKNLQKFGAYSDFAAQSYGTGGIPDWNRTPLNRVDFKSRVFDTKVKMPEFGGLAMSIKHFEMPTLPKLSELPSLSDALGKIRSLEDIGNLGVLPGSTARSPNRSLLNPQLMQTLQSLMKSKKRTPPSNENRKKNGDALPLHRLGRFHYGH